MERLDHAEQLANAKLFHELKTTLGAQGEGDVYLFCMVRADWRCPCCHRSKTEIARLDRNGNLLCSIVEHHDHFGDLACRVIPTPNYKEGDVSAANYVRYSFERFPRTVICGDCNVAEVEAKRIVGADSNFSFAPIELMQVLVVRLNSGHAIREDRVAEVYEAAMMGMKPLGAHLRAVVNAMKNPQQPHGMEQIGGAAVRVLAGAFANRLSKT